MARLGVAQRPSAGPAWLAAGARPGHSLARWHAHGLRVVRLPVGDLTIECSSLMASLIHHTPAGQEEIGGGASK
jgi:hypothetical protein